VTAHMKDVTHVMRVWRSHLCGAGQSHVCLGVRVPAALACNILPGGRLVGSQALALHVLDVHHLQMATQMHSADGLNHVRNAEVIRARH
jgi:hypothetical protein